MALATDDGRSTRGGYQSRNGDLAGAGESEKPFEVGPCVSLLSAKPGMSEHTGYDLSEYIQSVTSEEFTAAVTLMD